MEKEAEEVIDLDIPTDDDTDMFDNVPGLSRPSKKGSAKDTTSAKCAAMAARAIGTVDTSAVPELSERLPGSPTPVPTWLKRRKGLLKRPDLVRRRSRLTDMFISPTLS